MQKINKKLLTLIVLVCVIILSGCWDSTEPERMHYIFGVGIDYEDDHYVVYAQVINFENTAKSEDSTSEEVQSEVGRATGVTLDDAIVNLYHSMGRKVFWGDLSYVIFSESMLEKEKMNPIIDLFLRYRETRYQILFYSTKDNPKDVLLMTPITNISLTLSKLAEPESTFKQDTFIEPVNIRELLIGLNEPSHEVLLPFVEVTENWETIEEKQRLVKFSGVGVISRNEFKGFLVGEEVLGLPWMTEKTERKQLMAKHDSDSKLTATIKIKKVKVEPIMEDDSIKFDIRVKLNLDVGHIEEQMTSKEMEKEVIKQIKEEIKKTYEAGLKRDVDIYRLSEYVYRNDVKAWKRFQENGKVPLSEDSIRDLTIKVKVDGGRRNFKRTIE